MHLVCLHDSLNGIPRTEQKIRRLERHRVKWEWGFLRPDHGTPVDEPQDEKRRAPSCPDEAGAVGSRARGSLGRPTRGRSDIPLGEGAWAGGLSIMSSLVEMRDRERRGRERKNIPSAIFLSLYLLSSCKRNRPEGCVTATCSQTPDSGRTPRPCSLPGLGHWLAERKSDRPRTWHTGRQTPGRFTLHFQYFC